MQNYLHTVVEEMICDYKRRLKFHITYESRKLVVYVMGQLKVFFFKTICRTLAFTGACTTAMLPGNE